MNQEYEVVGVIDAAAAEDMFMGDDTILVEHDDPSERLIAAPKATDDE